MPERDVMWVAGAIGDLNDRVRRLTSRVGELESNHFITKSYLPGMKFLDTAGYVNVPVIRGLVVTDNSPSAGYVAWTGFDLFYNGSNYRIASGSSALKYIYWLKATSTTVLQASATAPAAAVDQFLVILNLSGSARVALFQNVIYADYISVASLAAIVIYTGALTVSGSMAVGTGGDIHSGQTAYDTGTGYWLDYNAGTPRFSLGNSAGNKLTWDGTTLAVTGTLTATVGTIGGWTIGATTISSTGVTLTSGATAYAAFGTTPPTSPTVGTGIYIDKTGLFGLNTNVPQAYINATGQLLAGAGAVILDSAGIRITHGSGVQNKIQWMNGATVAGVIFGQDGGSQNGQVTVSAYGTGAGTRSATLYLAGEDATDYGYANLVFAGTNKGMVVGAATTTVLPNAMLDVRGSGIFTGGLTLGTATGAAAGEIKTSASVLVKGPSPWADVKAWGATGDGTTNDSTAIQNAINSLSSGGIVNFPPGTYICNLTLNPSVWLKGAGIGVTTLKSPTNGGTVITGKDFATLTGKVYASGDTRRGAYLSRLSDLSIDGNKANQAGTAWGIQVWGCQIRWDNVLVRECKTGGIYTEFTTHDSGADWTQSLESHFDYIRSLNNDGNAWTYRGPHDAVIDDYVAFGNTGWAFYSEALTGYYNGAFYSGHDWNSWLNTTGSFHFGAGGKLDTCTASGAYVGIGVDIVAGTGSILLSNMMVAGHLVGLWMRGTGNSFYGHILNNRNASTLAASTDGNGIVFGDTGPAANGPIYCIVDAIATGNYNNILNYHETGPNTVRLRAGVGGAVSGGGKSTLMGGVAFHQGDTLSLHGLADSAADYHSIVNDPELTDLTNLPGDADVTLTPGKSCPNQLYATTLTANRTVTLSTTSAFESAHFRVVRSALGAYTLAIGALVTIPISTPAWAEVHYLDGAWRLTGYAQLDPLKLGGNLIWPTDNTYDIGASGATRPRDLFLGRNAVVGGTLAVTDDATLSAALAIGSGTVMPPDGSVRAFRFIPRAKIGGTDSYESGGIFIRDPTSLADVVLGRNWRNSDTLADDNEYYTMTGTDFGYSGIQLTHGGGIKFYGAQATTVAGNTFTPTERMAIANDGAVTVVGSLAVGGVTLGNGTMLLSATTLALNANADTTLYTVPAGKRCILSHAILVAGADAGATTTISIGADGAEADFLAVNTLSNLDAQYDAVILMPIPGLIPAKTKSYAAAVVIQARVGAQSGGATNTIYLYGTLY